MTAKVSLSLRLPSALRDQLVAAADERDVSVSWLAARALEDFLPRLIPVDEICWTKDAR